MTTSEPILSIRELVVSYGAIKALHGISMDVYEGEIVCVIGANGAGKSTLLNSVMGAVPVEKGEILFEGKPLVRRSYKVVASGICLVPEGRKIFGPLTVSENLMVGAFLRKDKERIQEDLEWVYTLFPRLKERKDQPGATLSGGEQQMLSIARSLMSSPRVLLLDEPSLGLAPILIKEIFDELKLINERGVTIVLVEQNARQALMLSHRGYVMQTGRVIIQGPSAELLSDPRVKMAYLGKLKA